MKTSSAPANSESSAEERARGCLSSNLAIPGLGSVMGGRKIGYVQMTLSFGGLALSLIFGIRFIQWSLVHWTEMHQPNYDDPFVPLRLMWEQVRWPLLGMVLFAVAWVWALATGYALLREAREKKAGP